MTIPSAEVVLVATDIGAVLPHDSALPVSAFAHARDALAHLGDLRARGAPAIFVLGRTDINRRALLMEVITRHPDVPVIVADRAGDGGWAAGHAVTRPPQSQALVESITEACRLAVQRSRVRTTIDRLNVRIAAAVADPRQQQRLMLSQLYLESILEQAQDAIFITDRAGIVALWNPAAERLFTIPPRDIIGQSIDRAGIELLHALQSLSLNTTSRLTDLEVRTPNGIVAVELSLGIVSDGNQNGVAVSGIARDVTERRALLRTLEQRAHELAEANRHKDEFLAVLSHELRTPLNVVLGWAHMLEEAPLEGDGLRRGLAMIRRNAELQQRLVDDLLDYARISAGRLSLRCEMIDVAEVVRATLDTLRLSIAENGLALVEAYDAAQRTWGDQGRIGQVVVNLLANAIKFTPKGGQISVRVHQRDGKIEIVVADTGEGISKDFLPHVFDEFRQANVSTTRKGSGLGLGLAISRRIVDMHHGTIVAESEGPGHGAAFRMTLPVRDMPLVDAPAADTAATA